MSIKHGGGVDSGASPVEPPAAQPDPAAAAPAGQSPDDESTAGTDRQTRPGLEADPGGRGDEGAASGDESRTGADPEAEIHAAGGTVVGESEIAGLADRSRVRRAPRYKRFAVLGGLLGVVVAAVATPFADFQQELSPWGLFLLLVTILVPLLILVSCAVAMLTDRAARVPPRQQRNRRPRR